MSLTGNSHPIVTRCSRVSRAPPNHTLPAFLILHGIIILLFNGIRLFCKENKLYM